MSKPTIVREFRHRDPSTSFSTSFTAANNAAWDPGTATKIDLTEFDDSASIHEGIEPKELQETIQGEMSHEPSIKSGDLKTSMYLGTADAGTTAPPQATLLSVPFGGLSTRAAEEITTDAVAACTTSVIEAPSHGLAVGNAVFFNGEVREIAAVGSVDQFTLGMAFSSAPGTSVALKVAHTVFIDESQAQQYVDLLAIGMDTANQRQWIGCVPTVEFSGLSRGEMPEMALNWAFGDWQWVPSGERDTLSVGTAASGNRAPASKFAGKFIIGDNGSVSFTSVQGSEFAISPNFEFSPIHDINGCNGIGGYQLSKANDVTGEFTNYFGQDMDGLYTDFTGKQAKQLIWQFGSTAASCVAFSMPKAYLKQDPTVQDLENLAAVKVMVRAVATGTSAQLANSCLKVHYI